MIGVISTRKVIYKAKLQKSAYILVELKNYVPQKDFFIIEIDYWAVDDGIKTHIESRPPLEIPVDIINAMVSQTGIVYQEGDNYVEKNEQIRKAILLTYVMSDILDDNPELTIYGLTPQEWIIFEE